LFFFFLFLIEFFFFFFEEEVQGEALQQLLRVLAWGEKRWGRRNGMKEGWLQMR
jgi:hypothetical protein